ncbi:MAG: protein kinase [Planctomycetes bacterium]|nr:protein kinase [Planctomycetota bacterium]
MQPLERALDVHARWLAAGKPTPPKELIAAHPDLAEFLEAMLTDRTELDRAFAAADENGRELGDYRLVRELGRGGMGVVYLAQQKSLDREVALKVLPNHVTLDAGAVARFRREATLAARLEHPNIVAIHAVGRVGDTHFFAMERIDGDPLGRIDPLTGQPRTIRSSVELCAKVAAALAHAHAQGVLHRDVKPANILVRRNGDPVLTDFGLARDIDQPGLTRTGTFAGTAHYASPEQTAGAAGVDARTDVWSLGATVYELLTGRKPFDGASTAEVVDRIRRTEPIDPLRLVPDLAPDLGAIVLKALEKDPARRYASAAEFGADLNAFLEFRPVSARRASTMLRLSRWVRREPLRATLAAVLAVGVPALALVAGLLIANRTAIQVGTREIRRQEQEERLARLTMYLESGEYDDALQQAELAIAERPDDIEARAMRALVQVYSGRGEPLAELDAAIAARKLAHGERARVHVLTAMGRNQEAQALAATLPEAKAPEELFLEGCNATLRGQNQIIDVAEWRTVRATFLRAMLVSPSPRLHYYLKWATAVAWCNEPDSTMQCNQVLLELWPESPAALLYVAFALRRTEPLQAAAMYRRVLAAGYTHPRIWSSIAECLDNAKDAAGAQLAHEEAVAAYQRREREGRLSATEELNLVIQLAEVGRRDAALERVRAFVARRPQNARAQRMLGWLLTEMRDLPGAIAALERALEIDPKDADALQRLGNAYVLAGQPARAVEPFRRLATQLPNNPNAHRVLGQAMFAANDHTGAVAALRRALDLAPKVAGLHDNLGSALRAGGDRAAARASFQRALELEPGNSPARVHLAEALLADNDAKAAIATLRTGIEVDGREAALWECLGRALRRDGSHDEARTALREAVARAVASPSTFEFLQGIARLARELADRDLERAALQRGLQLDPTAEQRATLERALGALDG